MDLKQLRKASRLTQDALAKKLGVDRRTIINYEKGEFIPESKIKLINLLLSENNSHVEKIELPTGYYYPNVSAAAGMDKEMQNDELKRLPINLPNWDKGIDFINVYGDSMYPKFCSGEIIGIKEVELQYMNFGYAYVVILKDEQVLLKYIKKGSDKEHIILESENDFYESKEYHLEQIKKVFIIKGVITKTTM
jgi:DNA-binding XRE family transcriptional regulator